MIRHQANPQQLRIDTTIKIINSDGTETVAPVLVLVGLNKVEDKRQYDIYRIANMTFNRDFTIDKRIKASSPKKPWYKFW